MNMIFKRRSIRKYVDGVISNNQVESLLKAAMAAPSTMNLQPWEFIVVRSKDTMNKIMKFHPYSKMLKEAQVAIIVCGNLNVQKIEGYLVQDCSAAIENILLQTEEIGLGGVWLGVYPNEERIKNVAKLFDLPSYIKPMAILSIGYPGEIKPESNRYDEKKVHKEIWRE